MSSALLCQLDQDHPTERHVSVCAIDCLVEIDAPGAVCGRTVALCSWHRILLVTCSYHSARISSPPLSSPSHTPRPDEAREGGAGGEEDREAAEGREGKGGSGERRGGGC